MNNWIHNIINISTLGLTVTYPIESCTWIFDTRIYSVCSTTTHTVHTFTIDYIPLLLFGISYCCSCRLLYIKTVNQRAPDWWWHGFSNGLHIGLEMMLLEEAIQDSKQHAWRINYSFLAFIHYGAAQWRKCRKWSGGVVKIGDWKMFEKVMEERTSQA